MAIGLSDERCKAAFGSFAGFATAWSYWTMIWAGNGAIAVAVVSSLSLIMPWIGSTAGMPALLSVVATALKLLPGDRAIALFALVGARLSCGRRGDLAERR